MHTDVEGEWNCERIPSHQYAPPPAHVPFIATRDNCHSFLSLPSLHLLILASSPTSFIDANQQHVNISVFVINASSSSSHSLPALVLIPKLFSRIFFSWNTLSFSNTVDHFVTLVHFPRYAWNTPLFYNSMNHLTNVVSCCPHPRMF